MERLRFQTDLSARFSSTRDLFGFEGGCVYEADSEGRYFLVIDEGTMADFIQPGDADLLDELITIYEFADPDARRRYEEARFADRLTRRSGPRRRRPDE